MNKSAELIGYFVPPEVWVKMVLKHIKLSQSPGSLMLLASVLRGSERSTLRPFLHDVISILGDPDICRSVEVGDSVRAACNKCVGRVVSSISC